MDEDGKQIGNEIIYNDILTFSKLIPNHQFGGRTLLPFDLYMQLKRIYFGDKFERKPQRPEGQPFSPSEVDETEEQWQLKSHLDVIADSGTVECFLITKQEMQYLSLIHI